MHARLGKRIVLGAAAAALTLAVSGASQARAGHGSPSKAEKVLRIVGHVLHGGGKGHGGHGHGGHGHGGHGHGGHGHWPGHGGGPGFPPPPPPICHYYVIYDMHGTRTLHLDSHRQAHRYADWLESLGVHADIEHAFGHYDVVYHMHGRRTREFTSHSRAHRFARTLERYGIHTRVVRR